MITEHLPTTTTFTSFFGFPLFFSFAIFSKIDKPQPGDNKSVPNKEDNRSLAYHMNNLTTSSSQDLKFWNKQQ